MIPVHHLVRALEKERARMRQQELNTDFIIGMIHGIGLSITIINDVWLRYKGEMANNPMGLKGRAT